MSIVGTVANDHTDRGLLSVVSRGLENSGLSVCLRDQEDSCILSVDIGGPFCELLISDDGYVELECSGQDSRSADPRGVADLAALLLTGHVLDHPAQDDQCHDPDITFKGIVGLEAKAGGLDVELRVHENEQLYDVTAEIEVTNPASRTAGTVRVTDSGCLLWEHEAWPDTSDECTINRDEVADSIIARLVPAISLAKTAFSVGKEPGDRAGQVPAEGQPGER